MTKRRGAAVAVLVTVLLASSCAVLKPLPGKQIVVPAYTLPAPHWAPGHLVAGAGRVDITPPPGFPTGGDGPAGNQTRGYWTRLYARAFFLADGTGKTALLVSCDLFAVPGGLSAMVAERVATTWSPKGVVIPPEAIVIAATHTHQGPGNYLTARAYNQFGSKYGGFELELFDFLVKGVTKAIDMAVNDAYHNPQEASLSIRTGCVSPSFQLNRSPRTFLLNWDARAIMDKLHPPDEALSCAPDVETGEALQDWNLPGCPRLRATDPALTVLDVRRGADAIGSLVFLAVHPTVLDAAAPFYSADFTGYAMERLEREAGSGRRPVVAFFNGAEGDVVTRRGRRDLLDVARIGDRLVDSVRQMKTSTALPVPSIEARRLPLPPGDRCPRDRPMAWLAPQPLPGVALLGGGEGDRSQLYPLGWSEGVRGIAHDGQGGKLGGLDSPLVPFLKLTGVLAGPETFPDRLPLTYIKLGSFAIGAFPAELSTATAAPIRLALGDHGAFEIIGLANEYSSYVASPDEYVSQDYMAASTLWGPLEGPLFGCRMEELSRAPAHPLPRAVDENTFNPGLRPEQLLGGFPLGPSAVGECRASPDEEMERVLLNREGAPERALPYFFWDEPTAAKEEFEHAARRRVRIQVWSNGKWETRKTPQGTDDDDGGANFLTILMAAPRGSSDKHRYWSAIWLVPVLEEGLPDEAYRFEIEVEGSNPLHSRPFHVDLSGKSRPQPVEPEFGSGSSCYRAK